MIIDRIIQTQNTFEMLTGEKPTTVYLGHSEKRELQQWASLDQSTVMARDIESIHRPEINGLLIYEVDAENHLVCA